MISVQNVSPSQPPHNLNITLLEQFIMINIPKPTKLATKLTKLIKYTKLIKPSKPNKPTKNRENQTRLTKKAIENQST